MEPHYVCIGGCGKVSPTLDKCNSIGCWRARNPLAECDCTDGKHTEFYKMYNPTFGENSEKSDESSSSQN